MQVLPEGIFRSTEITHKDVVHDCVFLESFWLRRKKLKFPKAAMALKCLCQPMIKPTLNLSPLKNRLQ